MLPRKHRLPRFELVRVKNQGRLIPGKLFSLLKTSNQVGASRFGFIVSKKISKKAVERNRIRRLLFEAVQAVLPRIKEKADFVFLVKKAILDQPLEVIKKETERIFSDEKADLKTD